MNAQQEIERLTRELAETKKRLDQLDPRPKQPEPIPVDTYLKKALERMGGDPEAAAALFVAWTEKHSEIRDSLKPLIQEALERRLALHAEEAKS